MTDSAVRYLVFDIESVADGNLVASVRYPGEKIKPGKAIARYRKELLEKYDSDFVPYTFQVPVSVAVAKVDEHYRILDLVTLDAPDYRPHVIAEHFWRGWLSYEMPTLVSFNGRTFDIPLMELAAFRHGISVPAWFNLQDRAYDQRRNRYNLKSHLDLHDLLTNFGATRFTGGLNLVANILGKPGKMDVSGYMVQDLYDNGKLAEINDYCRCDVLDTYFVFLRCLVLIGKLTLEQEQDLVEQTRTWLENESQDCPAFVEYLNQWGDWQNPWTSEESAG